MAAYKDAKRNTWYVTFYYRDWQGNNRKKKKRGFKTKREALEWEQSFRQKQEGTLDMPFKDFVEVYAEDMKPRLKHNTWLTKEHIIKTKPLPYFENKKMNEIRAADIVRWQSEMMGFRDENGAGYSKVYLKPLQSQLSAIFNHGIRLYELKENPVRKAGSMGGEKQREMLVWTKEEYIQFAEAVMDKPRSFYAFEILYWAGMRVGDLRHSHVSLLNGMGFSAVDIAGRMGHESIDITLHYAHMFPTAQKDMADKLNMERIW